MVKGYVKENGIYKLVEKDAQGNVIQQGPQVIINNKKTLSLEELDARIKRLEGLVIGAKK